MEISTVHLILRIAQWDISKAPHEPIVLKTVVCQSLLPSDYARRQRRRQLGLEPSIEKANARSVTENIIEKARLRSGLDISF